MYIIIYILMGILVGLKLYKDVKDDYVDPLAVAVVLSVIWPITLTSYIIRVLIFEDWI